MRLRYQILIMLSLIVLIGSKGWSQQKELSDTPKKYTIGGVKVSGLEEFSEQTVLSFTGLEEGSIITLPGDQLSKVIKKLWNLKLFDNVNIYITYLEADKVYLEIAIQEQPLLQDYKIEGIKKGKAKELAKDLEIKKGQRINQNFITNTKKFITRKYQEKGFLNTKVAVFEKDADRNRKKIIIRVDKGKKVKIKNINLTGNKDITDGEILYALKKTKKKKWYRFYKRSKYIEKEYRKDLKKMLEVFQENGYRDARIISDSVYENTDEKKKTLTIDIKLEEGNKYYFGDINFLGNGVYTNRQLDKVLRIKKGDVYNGVLLDKRISDKSKPDAQDISNLYQNSGYLFSRINPVEVEVKNDTINFEIRIVEGKPAYFNNIFVSGNDVTNDHVIYRELRTRPGRLYSKADVVRSVRELSQLGFFDPQKINPDFKNVDPNSGTLDLDYQLEEKGSSQVELQGGYGVGTGFIGTVGLRFNNVSIKNFLKLKEYRPVPRGDGQSLAVRLQASQFYRVASLSFSEPWLGGRKPVRFSVSFSLSQNFLYDPVTRSANTNRFFEIYGLSVGLDKRLRVPDDYFTLSQAISYKYYNLNNYNTSLFTFGNGVAHSIAYTIGLSRNSSGPNPIFPMSGSSFSTSLKLTPPYSLFSGKDYDSYATGEEFKRKDSQGFYLDSSNARVSTANKAAVDQSKIDQDKFKFLEFYKFKFKADWYNNIFAKLVLKFSTEFGVLGAYNDKIGLVPFERFFVGGDGMRTNTLDGRENIRLRGYPNQSLSGQDGSAVYNKFSMELRYPITLKPSASIFGLVFAEGGNSINDIAKYNPFVIKKSLGLGLRVFMSAFGMLGIDFGYGFDPINGLIGNPSGWQTHFTIGQQF